MARGRGAVKRELNRSVLFDLALANAQAFRQLGGMSEMSELRQDTESPKRKVILEAATELFMAHGYGAVSMDAIARAAGVSKATLYAYFTSKDQLFATIIREACLQSVSPHDPLPADATDVRAALLAFGGRLLRFLLEPRSLAIHRVVIAESVRFPELGTAFYDSGPAAIHRLFSEWLAEQAAAGRLAVPDPITAADQFLSLLKTRPFLRASLGLPPPTDAEVEAVVTSAVATFLKAYTAG
jgi:TetR/AcrR family transcriptional repressor of mexJK operon